MMSYLFILFLLAQTTSGQVTVTLLDSQQAPVVSETIELVNEQRQTIGSCVTNANGRCTITLSEIPADSSGFIRGTIAIPGRGQRPVIWPGGPLEVSIILDPAGQIFVPSDHYATKTPESLMSDQLPASGSNPQTDSTGLLSNLIKCISIIAAITIAIIYFFVSKRIFNESSQ